MLFVVGTFALVLALVLGVYWVAVARPEHEAEKLLKRRLSPGHRPRRAPVLTRQAERLSSIPVINQVLASAAGVSSPLQRTISQAGMKTTVGVLVLGSATLAMAAWLAVGTFTGLRFLGFVIGLIAGSLPFVYVRYRARKRLQTFEEQFPEAIDLIARALRAGHTFTTGLAMVADEAPQPVAGEFRLLYDQQNFGMPLPEAMRIFADRVPLIDARFFATAVLTQRESGGNLAEILDNLSQVIRERFKVKRQIRVISAHGRITGWVLTALPPGLAVAFLLTSPGHIQMLFGDPLGRQMMLLAIVLQVVGTLIIRRLVDIEY